MSPVMTRTETKFMVMSLAGGVDVLRRLGGIGDRNGPEFALGLGHVSTRRPSAGTPGAAAAGWHADGGRTRRPAQRGRTHRAAVCGAAGRARCARGVGARPLRRVPAPPPAPPPPPPSPPPTGPP